MHWSIVINRKKMDYFECCSKCFFSCYIEVDNVRKAEEAIRKNGIATAAAEAEKIAQAITAEGGVVDYVTALDGDSLEELNEKSRSLLLALAAYFGNTRLIDNIYLEF